MAVGGQTHILRPILVKYNEVLGGLKKWDLLIAIGNY